MPRRHAWVPLLLALLLASPAAAQTAWYRVSFTSDVNIPETTLDPGVGCGQMSGVLGDFLAAPGSTTIAPAQSPIEAITSQFVDCDDMTTLGLPARSWTMVQLLEVLGAGDSGLYLQAQAIVKKS